MVRVVPVMLLVYILRGALQTTLPTMTWYKVLVSTTLLDDNIPKGEMSALSVTQCASLAAPDPLNRLLCFKTPGVCTKYDLRVGAKHDDSSKGPVTSCWTRHLTGVYKSAMAWPRQFSFATCINQTLGEESRLFDQENFSHRV